VPFLQHRQLIDGRHLHKPFVKNRIPSGPFRRTTRTLSKMWDQACAEE
jgi:hypothetical protein